MPVINGFDPDRDRWSRDATELLFPDIARRLFGLCTIDYAWNPLLRIDRLDKHYGVDVVVKSENRNYAIAIRIRSLKYYDYQDITIRYESLQSWGKLLEAQKSIARLMFYAWADVDWPTSITGFVEWHLIDLQGLMDCWIKQQIFPKGTPPNTDESSTLAPFALVDLLKFGLVHNRQLRGQAYISKPEEPKPPAYILEIQGIMARVSYEQRMTNFRLEKMDYELSQRRRKPKAVDQTLTIFPIVPAPLALPEPEESTE